MDFGTPQSLLSSAGTILFNEPGAGLGLDDACMYFLQGEDGWDTADIRNPTNVRPRRDGGLIHPFFKGGKVGNFDCLIVSSTPENRQTMSDHFLGVTDPLLREDGTFTWEVPTDDFPAAGEERSNTVRLYEPCEITSAEGGAAGPKHCTFTLLAYGVEGEDGF